MTTFFHPLPSEEKRIETLKQYWVMDTPPEQALNEITEMAAQICGTPIALISLVDEQRQWFKSRVGLEAPETPREISFCAHTLEKRELAIVANALEDARFQDNPLVTGGPKIRFYAGAPLVSPENAALGTLCVIDSVPRVLTMSQQQALTFLAGQVMTHLELRRQMIALRASEERFASAFENAPIGIALVSTEGKFLQVNRSLCDLLGYSTPDLLEKSFQEITCPEDLEADLDHVRDLLAGRGFSYRMEKRYYHSQGHLIWVDLSVSLVTDKQGRPLYFISQIQDITRNKETLEKQTILAQKAQAAEKAKSEFLATMSHEIRTPLNGVIGMTSVLMDTELNEIQKQCVDTIQVSGESLLVVINDILDYSKIEAGRLEIEHRPFGLKKCLEDVFHLFSAQFEAKNLQASYDIASNVPPKLIGDALRLRQILVNLVGNAIKFTAAGKIGVHVARNAETQEDCTLVFSVVDTGIGIDEAGVSKLFHAFQQVDTSTTRRYGGTGLGLAISKRLAEFMGGTMWVESEPGVGSTFSFSAVFQTPVEKLFTRSQEIGINLKSRKLDSGMATKHPLRILLAEDNSVNQKVAQMILSRLGYTASIAANGKEVLELLKGRAFDVILMDIQMPEMNGMEAADAVRKKYGAMTPHICALTAEALEGDEQRFLNLGFDGYLSKPLQASTLQRVLAAIKAKK